MSVIVQLSDLHLRDDDHAPQREIFDFLVAALEQERARHGRIDLLAITGDVFDTSRSRPSSVIARFRALHARVDAALGGGVPAVILPGNHDRRSSGVVGPHSEELFTHLKAAMGDAAWVHGCTTPFLAALVPDEVHGFPADIVAYDSTYLPRGLLSAGGAIRQEDLLQIAAELADRPSDRPVVLLMHHHLIPTPLTDLGAIETHGQSGALRWVLGTALPALVSNADREELTMTALGAGTAISTLHAFGRAVLVMHGHKHYPSVRLLRAIHENHGDVMLAAAGSAGTVQRWSMVNHPDVPRLWPSFNVVELDGTRLTVETVSFRYKPEELGVEDPQLLRRVHVVADQRGMAWRAEAISDRITENSDARLEANEAIFRLTPNAVRPGHLWDLACERRVRAGADDAPERYVEVIEALPGAPIVDFVAGGEARPDARAPASAEIPLQGATSYRVVGASCRTMEEAARAYGTGTAFESVGLLNRYQCGVARISLEGLSADAGRAFGGATDLTIGRESPVRVHRSSERVVLECEECAPRTMLRIYWPLER